MTTAFPLPLTCETFVIPFPSPSLYLAPSYSTPFVPTEPSQYGSRMVPLPDDDSIGNLGGNSLGLHSDTINPTSELAAPVSPVCLRGAQLPLRSDSPHQRGYQGGEKEVLCTTESHGATGACFWSTLHLD